METVTPRPAGELVALLFGTPRKRLPGDLTYSTGHLARLLGTKPRVLRFYEERGLVQPRRTGPLGHGRAFSETDRLRLEFILFCRRSGLSVREAGELLAVSNLETSTPAPDVVRALLCDQRAETMRQLTDLGAALTGLDDGIAALRSLERRPPLPKARKQAALAPA